MKRRSPLVLVMAGVFLVATIVAATAAAPIKIGVAYDQAGLGDMAFNDMVASGAATAEADLGVKLFEREAVKPNGTLVDTAWVLAKLSKNADLVVAVGFLYGDAAFAAATADPTTNFAVIDWATVPGPPNLLGAVTAAHEGSFLVGAAAALESDTGKVGFIGGGMFDPILQFQAGYGAGAQYIDDQVMIYVDYIDTFSDPAAAYSSAMAMYADGVDVIYHAAGGAGYGLYQAAHDYSIAGGNHVWAIGVDVDAYVLVDDDIKPHILTSMLKNYAAVTYDIIESQVLGTFTGGFEVWDLSRGGVDYATSGGFVEPYVDQLEEIRAGIINGTIPVPTVP